MKFAVKIRMRRAFAQLLICTMLAAGCSSNVVGKLDARGSIKDDVLRYSGLDGIAAVGTQPDCDGDGVSRATVSFSKLSPTRQSGVGYTVSDEGTFKVASSESIDTAIPGFWESSGVVTDAAYCAWFDLPGRRLVETTTSTEAAQVLAVALLDASAHALDGGERRTDFPPKDLLALGYWIDRGGRREVWELFASLAVVSEARARGANVAEGDRLLAAARSALELHTADAALALLPIPDDASEAFVTHMRQLLAQSSAQELTEYLARLSDAGDPIVVGRGSQVGTVLDVGNGQVLKVTDIIDADLRASLSGADALDAQEAKLDVLRNAGYRTVAIRSRVHYLELRNGDLVSAMYMDFAGERTAFDLKKKLVESGRFPLGLVDGYLNARFRSPASDVLIRHRMRPDLVSINYMYDGREEDFVSHVERYRSQVVAWRLNPLEHGELLRRFGLRHATSNHVTAVLYEHQRDYLTDAAAVARAMRTAPELSHLSATSMRQVCDYVWRRAERAVDARDLSAEQFLVDTVIVFDP